MPGDYSQNRSASRANRPPVNRNNPRTSVRKTPTRYVDGPAYPREGFSGRSKAKYNIILPKQNKIHTEKKRTQYAQARRKFYIWDLTAK